MLQGDGEPGAAEEDERDEAPMGRGALVRSRGGADLRPVATAGMHSLVTPIDQLRATKEKLPPDHSSMSRKSKVRSSR